MTVSTITDILAAARDEPAQTGSRDIRAVFHELLLRTAGAVPDDLIVAARAWLAEDDLGAVARAITYAAVTYRIPVLDSDIVALAVVLGDIAAGQAEQDGAEPDDLLLWLDQVEVSTAVIAPPVAFVPTLSDAPENLDAVDEAALLAVAAEPGVRGMWRSWRRPRMGSAWPPPRRVFVIEIDADENELPTITHRIQQRLVDAGEPLPQVEVYPTGAELPMPYQRQAQMFGVLVWAADQMPELSLASVCDEVDAAGVAAFHADHPTVDDDAERDRMLAYLLAGTLLLSADRMTEDIVDTSRGEVVPMSIRTDGRWIWSDATAYYLAEHRLAPDSGLMRHLGAAPASPPHIDDVAFQRILGWLNAS